MKTILKSLECPVCLQIFFEPRVLTNCGHSVCTSCINNLSSVPSMVECPICQVRTHYSNIEDIQINFSLMGIIDEILKEGPDTAREIRENIPTKDVNDYLSRTTVDTNCEKRKTPWWSIWCLKEDPSPI